MIVPVILSGGSGTRLWPVSRVERPKQLLPVVDDRTMLRATIDRLGGIDDAAPPYIVCNTDQAALVQSDMRAAGLDDSRVIVEPVARNTAPAAAAAGQIIAENRPNATMLLLPADHVISQPEIFHSVVNRAYESAKAGHLVTFGVVPGYAETGYGYIRTGEPFEGGHQTVAQFTEKPDAATAAQYLASGGYLWNSGMFLFGVADFANELKRFAPRISGAVTDAVTTATRESTICLGTEAFASSPSSSIDLAVMEHTERAVVYPLNAGWSDVGSWQAVWQLKSSDRQNNVTVGDVFTIDSSQSYVRAESRMVAAIGIRDMVIVETEDAVLVSRMDRSQDVKLIVDSLLERGRSEATGHTTTTHKWGTSTRLTERSEPEVQLLRFVRSAQVKVDPARVWTLVGGAGSIEGAGETADKVGSSITFPTQSYATVNPVTTLLVVVAIVS